PLFSDTLELDLGTVEPSLAGPKRPQDRVPLSKVQSVYAKSLDETLGPSGAAGGAKRSVVDEKGPDAEARKQRKVAVQVGGATAEVGHGAVVIAAITSCTNTSNPAVMLGAGLLAKNAVARGLTASKPWVKTSLAPGSRVVTEYLQEAGLLPALEKLGFN